MTVFCYKKATPTLRLSDKIKKTREEQGLALTQVAEISRVPLKYVVAIEDGTFNNLPKARAHRLAYVRELSEALKLPSDECLKQFENEAGFDNTASSHPHQDIKLFPFASISIIVRNLIMASMVIFFAGYLVWQVRGILEPPYLAVFSPSEGYIVNKPKALIEGETEKETKLTVNGKEIMVSEQGKFSTEIDLSAGVNTIEISATKKHGKTTSVTRHVVVKLPSEAEPISLK